MVVSGGKFLYITCSIFSEENELNVKYILEKYNNIKKIKEIKITPDEYADGFFYCLFEKNN